MLINRTNTNTTLMLSKFLNLLVAFRFIVFGVWDASRRQSSVHVLFVSSVPVGIYVCRTDCYNNIVRCAYVERERENRLVIDRLMLLLRLSGQKCFFLEKQPKSHVASHAMGLMIEAQHNTTQHVKCVACGSMPLSVGYKCNSCFHFDLCQTCYESNAPIPLNFVSHKTSHKFTRFG
jgi:hypothetical protein